MVEKLQAISLDVRKKIIELSFRAGKNSAHVGGSLSCVEILTVLYHSIMKKSQNTEERDRVILSKGHSSLAHYCVLNSVGLISDEELNTFEQNGSHYTAHAKKDISKGLEFTGGSLGLGISYAVGVAEALKEKQSAAKVYTIVGDGECNEGIVWEALMFAAHRNLTNLVVIVDKNNLQADGTTKEVMNTESLDSKFQSFGFNAMLCNGHSVEELINCFNATKDDMPNVIIAETVKGKGVSFMEGKTQWHFSQLPEKKYLKAITELNNSVL